MCRGSWAVVDAVAPVVGIRTAAVAVAATALGLVAVTVDYVTAAEDLVAGVQIAVAVAGMQVAAVAAVAAVAVVAAVAAIALGLVAATEVEPELAVEWPVAVVLQRSQVAWPAVTGLVPSNT